MEYVPTIGLEIHAELKTATKMFCDSKNDANEKHPNVNVCPVCLAHPGTLPVINREAVKHVLRVGLALDSKLADYTEFDRKNYFYPDLPKGYQISQYEYPLVSGGTLSGVAITRIHLEEDTASSVHDDVADATLIDFNRSGVPLMELVTDPVIKNSTQAGSFARELQLLLRYLGASDANMDKGEMRVEANISVSKTADLGTKVEVKNLNSFRAMERAVDYEIKRQIDVLNRGENVIQETRGWDENKQATFAQRIKEGSADYRYFPDPDLPSLKISEIEYLDRGTLLATIPELPWVRRARYLTLGVKQEDADAYVRDTVLGAFFEDVILGATPENVVLASNYISNDLINLIRDMEIRDTDSKYEIPISTEHFRKLINMASEKKISSRATKDILQIMLKDNQDPEEIAHSHNLFQNTSGDDLVQVVDRVIKDNQVVVHEYKIGKLTALEFLIGQCMKATRGTADAGIIRELLRSNISL
jgi:aspartyl-tRNA(Asn)/glutamyl-tRNA(Gln) amidotransferase subunit B